MFTILLPVVLTTIGFIATGAISFISCKIYKNYKKWKNSDKYTRRKNIKRMKEIKEEQELKKELGLSKTISITEINNLKNKNNDIKFSINNLYKKFTILFKDYKNLLNKEQPKIKRRNSI